MNNDNRESQPDAIERLIADEEAAALAEFRTKDFPAYVQRRIDEEAWVGRPSRALFSGRLLRPASIAAAAALVCAVVAFFVLPRGSSSNETAAMIQRALLGMPGIQTPDRAAGADLETARLSGAMPSSFASVFAAGRAEIAAGERTMAASPLPGGELRAPHLSLREKYEILIIEKSVERVLAQLANKFKEG